MPRSTGPAVAPGPFASLCPLDGSHLQPCSATSRIACITHCDRGIDEINLSARILTAQVRDSEQSWAHRPVRFESRLYRRRVARPVDPQRASLVTANSVSALHLASAIRRLQASTTYTHPSPLASASPTICILHRARSTRALLGYRSSCGWRKTVVSIVAALTTKRCRQPREGASRTHAPTTHSIPSSTLQYRNSSVSSPPRIRRPDTHLSLFWPFVYRFSISLTAVASFMSNHFCMRRELY